MSEKKKTGSSRVAMSFRIERALLAQLRRDARKQGLKYQTYMHALLLEATERGGLSITGAVKP